MALIARRLLALTAVVLAAPFAIFVSTATASPTARFGIQDDAWLLTGPGSLEQRLGTLDRLGVHTVRLTLRWDQVAPTKPATPLDPADPAYDWGPFDAALEGLHAHGVTAVVTIWGAPRWANGGHAAAWLPHEGLGDFAYAASKRYPSVHLWTVWNEPNSRLFAVPVSPAVYVRDALNPAYAGLHRASAANVVAGGVTSPRKTASGLAPTAFMSGMRAAHARLDAYAANPYPSSSRETPFVDPCRSCDTLTMARLGTIRAEVTRLFGNVPLWLTEYGYQTNPPDRLLGVSDALQAKYIGEAALRTWEQPGVTMLIQFLVQDEPGLGGWQSGLFTVGGVAKPALRAFQLPLAELSRRGAAVTLWGQVRPGTGRRRFAIQQRSAGRWIPLGPARLTGVKGTFRVAVRARPGCAVRIVTPELGDTDPPLVLR
jgi:hypothetical protein